MSRLFINNTVVNQQILKRTFSTVKVGYMENHKGPSKHPQILQTTSTNPYNDSFDNIIVDNNKSGLTHNVPSPEKQAKYGLSKIVAKASIGMDAKNQKPQFMVTFDESYSNTELNTFVQDHTLTQHCNKEEVLAPIRNAFATARAVKSQIMWEKLVSVSDSVFKDTEKMLSLKKTNNTVE